MITQKTFHVKGPLELAKALKTASSMEEYKNASAVLAQVYIEAWDEKYIKSVAHAVGRSLPKAVVCGMTNINHELGSFEEIFDGKGILDKMLPLVVLSVMCFEKSSLCMHVFDCSQTNEVVAGGCMGQLLAEEKDAKGVLLLAAGFEIAVEPYLAMAAAANGSIPFFGATACVFKRQLVYSSGADTWAKTVEGDNCLKNYLYYLKDGQPVLIERGFLNVVFKGEELHVFTSYNLGWTPVGKPMRIEEVEGDRLVKRIDGQPASQIYKKYLGLRSDQLVSENVCEFPFMIRREGRNVARLGFKVEDDPGALAFSSPVFEGDVLRLSYGNPDDIFTESSLRAEELLEFQTQAMIASVCLNRGVLLQDDVKIEQDMYHTVAPEYVTLHGNGEILFDAEGGGELASVFVAAAFREGEKNPESTAAEDFYETCPYRSVQKVPLVHRLLTFLSATSSELEEALLEARAANEAKSMFLSNVSHEIRTPINAVLGLDEMILRESKEREIRRYALDIQNSGRTLLSLINDLLDSSRIDAGKMELVPVEYDLASLLNDLVNMTSVRAEEKNLKLVVNVEESIPHLLFGDDTRLKQCVLNILTNAVKYTREGSVTLDVSAKAIDGEHIGLSFSVSDTGIGIREEDIPHLFTAFERLDEEKNRGIEGTGLGMNIVTSILSLMGSELQVESTYGEGSRFYFTVTQEVRSTEPIGNFTEMYERSVETAVNYRETFHAPDARILVVDDTRMNLTVIRGLLKDTQIAIDTAESGAAALALVDKKPYDIIFLDQRMPQMDGTETLRRMQSLSLCNDLNRKTPVIMLTADAVSGARERFLEAGFDDYLSKPVNGRKLEGMLISYLPKEKVQMVREEIEEFGGDFDGVGDGAFGGGDASAFGGAGVDGGGFVGGNTGAFGGSAFLDALSGIESFSVEMGLKNCMSEDILRETVGDFVLTAKTTAGEIEEFLENGDWKNYTIRVHALKSSARIIGAAQLSEAAAYLEGCGDEEKAEEIAEKTPALLAEYRRLAEALAGAIEEAKGAAAGRGATSGAYAPAGGGVTASGSAGGAFVPAGGVPSGGVAGGSYASGGEAYGGAGVPGGSYAPAGGGAYGGGGVTGGVYTAPLDPIDEAQFISALSGVRELVEAYDYDGAGDILVMLAGYDMTEDQRERYEEMNLAVRRLDRDAVLSMEI